MHIKALLLRRYEVPAPLRRATLVTLTLTLSSAVGAALGFGIHVGLWSWAGFDLAFGFRLALPAIGFIPALAGAGAALGLRFVLRPSSNRRLLFVFFAVAAPIAVPVYFRLWRPGYAHLQFRRALVTTRCIGQVAHRLHIWGSEHSAFPVTSSDPGALPRVLGSRLWAPGARALDAWGRPLVITSGSRSYTIVSLGSDGIPDWHPSLKRQFPTEAARDIVFRDGDYLQILEGICLHCAGAPMEPFPPWPKPSHAWPWLLTPSAFQGCSAWP